MSSWRASGSEASVVLLFNSQVSGNCYKIRLLLAHLGLSYDRREVDGWLERVAGRAGHVNITA